MNYTEPVIRKQSLLRVRFLIIIFSEDNTMTATLFTIIIIGVIFWLAFQNGVLAFFAALCILGLIALIVDEARKEKEEERWLKEQETTV